MLKLIVLLAATLGFQQATAPAVPAPTATLSVKTVTRDGGILPGVTVRISPAALTVVNGKSNVVESFVVGMSGTAQIDGITPGTYALTFELGGFTGYARPRTVLAAGQALDLRVALEMDRFADWSDMRPMATLPNPVAPKTVLDALAPGEEAVGVWTSLGTFYLAVDGRRAPLTAGNFLAYVDAKLYDNGRFHRATRPDNYTPSLPNRPMMNIIQGGIDPARRAKGSPPIPLERTNVTGIKHVTGVISMARGTGADTATSDFFVLLDDQPSLDFGGQRFDDGQGGAAFGHVLSGLDVVRTIQQQPVDGQNLSGPVTILRMWRVWSSK